MRDSQSVQSQFHFIYVAPSPIFAGFERLHDGMFGGVKMLGGMLVFGAVAAAHVAALETQAQVHPGVAHFQTFLATAGVGLHVVDVA
jgi:hypothetical protein